MQNNNSNLNTPSPYVKNPMMLDLLQHEINAIFGADVFLKRFEKMLANPEVAKNLSFEQIMSIMDKKLTRIDKAQSFLIAFCKVNSKSQAITSAMERYLTSAEASTEASESIAGSSSPAIDVEARALIFKQVRDIAAKLRAANEEDIVESHEN